jgi:hypothetical protein
MSESEITPKQIEIRIGGEGELSVVPTTLHAEPGERIRWTVSLREKQTGALVVTFPNGTPFDYVQLVGEHGIAEADVRRTENEVRGIYHYTVAAAVFDGDKPRIAAITGCPEIIVQR